ncbi:MAG: hypothetical protein DRJ10_06285 [Bacteroidetes bacterium]|nr:MAG: hypothetical protein DRJ10_06285 [Bacteroidota bacterium]
MPLALFSIMANPEEKLELDRHKQERNSELMSVDFNVLFIIKKCSLRTDVVLNAIVAKSSCNFTPGSLSGLISILIFLPKNRKFYKKTSD